MLPQQRDPLLRGTRLLLQVAGLFCLMVAVGALAALAPVWLFGDHVTVWLTAHFHGAAIGRQALAAVSVILLGFAVMNGLALYFLRNLIAIIDSVGQGSPFIPENAARLRTMGWISLGVQGLALLAIPLTEWLRHVFANPHIFIPFSLAGLVTALLLFILARVFEHGMRLAQDVEGTV